MILLGLSSEDKICLTKQKLNTLCKNILQHIHRTDRYNIEKSLIPNTEPQLYIKSCAFFYLVLGTLQ